MVFEFFKNLHNEALSQAKKDTWEAMHQVHEQVEENQRVNGLAKVKKESIHEEAHRITKKMSMNNG